MTQYSKLNVIYHLQKWMDSVAGQTFLNYAYSWGASIVILGTLFKLTHLPYANILLFIGMGTEVFVFFISAFDRPFDKTTDGMVLQHGTAPAVTDEQVEHARRRMLGEEAPEQQRTDYERHMHMAAQKLKEAEDLARQLPQNGQYEDILGTLNALHEIYKVQLEKAGEQIATSRQISKRMTEMASLMEQLNGIYGRMLKAAKGEI
jgi:hypothetical protein